MTVHMRQAPCICPKCGPHADVSILAPHSQQRGLAGRTCTITRALCPSWTAVPLVSNRQLLSLLGLRVGKIGCQARGPQTTVAFFCRQLGHIPGSHCKHILVRPPVTVMALCSIVISMRTKHLLLFS